MNICILTVGSRGDIDPLVALACGLRDSGHGVRLVANSEGRATAETAGIDFGDLDFSVAALLRSAPGSSILHGGSAHQSRSGLIDAAVAATPAVGPRIVAHCDDADAILSVETVHLLARSIAEQRQVPHIALGFAPYGRTTMYPSFYADTPELRALPNLATHDAVERYHHGRLLPPVNQIRRDMLGLADLTVDDAFAYREQCPAVLGYSPAVFPPPPDWPIARDVTGYWRLPDAGEPVSAALVDFVTGGPPPIYVGFGSMNYDLPHLARLLVELGRRAGVRIVFATGWTNRDATRSIDWPQSIFVTDSAPHSWLFPRVAAVIHHGGAGTTAAAILAGTPSLVAWFIVDQVFWAGRIDQLGVGLDLGCFHDLDVERMIDAVGRLQADRAFSVRAAELRSKVAEEDGVGLAVRAIERHIRFCALRKVVCIIGVSSR